MTHPLVSTQLLCQYFTFVKIPHRISLIIWENITFAWILMRKSKIQKIKLIITIYFHSGNKSPIHRFLDKKDCYNFLYFLNFGLPHQNILNSLICQPVKTPLILILLLFLSKISTCNLYISNSYLLFTQRAAMIRQTDR